MYFTGTDPEVVDLLALHADRLIRSCSVCLYAGPIVSPEVLENCPEGTGITSTARVLLNTIIKTIQATYATGKDVTHLQSGGPSVWSTLAEQVRRLSEPGIDYEIVPGASALSTAAAALDHKLTVPTIGQSVVLTRIFGRTSKMPEGETLENPGHMGATLCIRLAIHDTDRVVKGLTPHCGKHDPVAVVAFAFRPEQVIPRGMLSDITQ